MSVTVKVLDANRVIESHQVPARQTLVLDAKDNVNYQLVNNSTGYAPQNIITSRDGDDLIIHLSESDRGVALGKDQDPAIIIKDYYAQDGVSNLIVGLHENGSLYAYVPESGSLTDAITALAEEMIKPQALGGSVLGGAFWTFNPWWLLGALAVAGIAAAAAGGGSGGGGSSAPAVADAATITTTGGGVVVLPGADNSTLAVTYVDENGQTQSVSIAKQADGTWAAVDAAGNVLSATALAALTAKGVSIDSATGRVTLAPNAVQDASTVSVVASAEGKNNNTKTAQTPAADNVADAPAVNEDASGVISATPGADNDTMTVSYTDENGQAQTVTVKKQADGTWAPVDANGNVIPATDLPKGVSVDSKDGTVSLAPNAVKDGSDVTVNGSATGKQPTSETLPSSNDTVADAPIVTASEKDGISATPGEDNDTMTVEYTDENGNKQTVTVAKQADGTWAPVDKDGNVIPADQLPKGVTVEPKDGTVSLAPNAVKDGTDVNVSSTSAGKTPSEETVTAPEDTVADEPKVNADDKGNVTATPGADNDTMVVEYTDENGNPQSVVVAKQPDGTWAPVDEKGNPLSEDEVKALADKGVTVDPKDGTVTLDPNATKDGTDVKVTGKSGDKAPAEENVTTAPTDSVADKPEVTADPEKGISATPGADNDTMTVEYTDENGDKQTVTVAKQDDGSWAPVDKDGKVIPAEELPKGVTVDPKDGTVSLAPNAVKDGTDVNVTGSSNDPNKADTTATETAPEDTGVADEPKVNADDKGNVTATPGADNDTMVVEYTDENGNPQSVVVAKQPDGTWAPVDEKGNPLSEDEVKALADKGVTVDPKDGTVTLDPNATKEGTDVKVTGKSGDKAPAEENVTTAPTDSVADKPEVTADPEKGISATPGEDNDTMTVEYTDENGDKQTVTVAKQDNGSWAPVDKDGNVIPAEELPKGVSVNPEDGTVSLEPNAVKDGTDVNVTGSSNDQNKADTTATETAPEDTVADEPTVETVQEPVLDEEGNPVLDENGEPVMKDTGAVTAKPGEDNDTMVVEYTDEDGNPQSVVVAKQPDGTWAPVDEKGNPLSEDEVKALADKGVTVDPTDGTVTLDPNATKEGTDVNVTGKSGDKQPTTETETTPDTDGVADRAVIEPTTVPVLDDEGNPVLDENGEPVMQETGGVSATPGEDNDTMTVEYTDENGDKQTVTVAKQDDGSWAPVDKDGNVIPAEELPKGVTVDPKDGTVSLEPNAVKDASEVKATTTSPEKDPTETTVDVPEDTVADEPTVETVQEPVLDEEGNPVLDENGEPVMQETGGVSATPGEDNDTMVVEYTDENGKPQSVVVAKQENGDWVPVDKDGKPLSEDEVKALADKGVTVDPTDGTVTLDPNATKEGTDVNVTGKSGDKQPTTETETTPDTDGVADRAVIEPTTAPVLDEEGNPVLDENGEPLMQETGGVSATPGEDNDTMIVEYTDENGDKQSIKMEKQGDTWNPVDENGSVIADEDLPKGVTVDHDKGTVTVDANSLEDGSEVKATTTSPEKDPTETTADAPVDTVADRPTVETVQEPVLDEEGNQVLDENGKPVMQDTGAVTAKPGEDNDTMVVEYTDENGKPQSVVVAKQPDGTWAPVDEKGNPLSEDEVKALADKGVTVDPKDGTVTLEPNAVKDNTDVNVTGSSKDKLDTTETVTTTEDNIADKPTVEKAVDEKGKETGGVTVTPGEDNTEILVTYTDENGDPQSVKLVKEGNIWIPVDAEDSGLRPDELPSGVTYDPDTGEVTISPNSIKDNTEVSVTGFSEGKKDNSDTETAPEDTVADEPAVTPNASGEVSVKPGADNNKMVVTYTDEDGKPQSVVVAEQSDGSWAPVDKDGEVIPAEQLPKGVTVAEDGTVTLAPNAVKDNSEVVATGSSEGKADTDGKGVSTTDNVADVPKMDTTKEGAVTAKPGDDNDSMLVTYTDENGDPQSVKVVKEGNTWKAVDADNNDAELPLGVSVDPKDGTVTLEPYAVKDDTQVDATGSSSGKGNDEPATAKAPVDTTKPDAPTAEVATTEEGNTIVKGTAEPGSTVTLKDSSGNVVGTAVADKDGNYEIPVEGLVEDDYTLTAKDASGNESDPAEEHLDNTPPAVPTVKVTNNDNGTSTITGTAEPGSTVTIYDTDGTTPLGTAVADEDGNYEITVPTLADKQDYNVTATDKAGNESDPATATGDTTPAQTPKVDSSDANLDAEGNPVSHTVKGTGEPGTTVQIRDKDGNVVGEAVVDDEGNYSITTDKPLDGNYDVVAVDDHGNESDAVPLDKEAPVLEPWSGALVNSNGNTVIEGVVLNKDGEPEVGATVELKDKDGNVIGTAVTDKDGKYELTSTRKLVDGEELTITATDTAGNESNVDNFIGKEVYPPIVDSVKNNDDNTVSTLTGRTSPNAEVIVTLPDGTTTKTTADENGNFSIDVPTAQTGEEYKLTAEKDGVKSDPDTPTKVPGDTTNPETPTVESITNKDGGSEIKGTAEPGTTVKVKDPETGDVLGEAVADKYGNYTIQTSKPLENEKEYNVTATDAHNNESEPAKAIGDTEAPAAPEVTDVTHTPEGTTITGKAEENSTVQLKDKDGNVIGETTADADGNYTITTDKPLENGDYDITATDGHGNESNPTTKTVDIEDPTVTITPAADGSVAVATANAETLTITYWNEKNSDAVKGAEGNIGDTISWTDSTIASHADAKGESTYEVTITEEHTEEVTLNFVKGANGWELESGTLPEGVTIAGETINFAPNSIMGSTPISAEVANIVAKTATGDDVANVDTPTDSRGVYLDQISAMSDTEKAFLQQQFPDNSGNSRVVLNTESHDAKFHQGMKYVIEYTSHSGEEKTIVLEHNASDDTWYRTDDGSNLVIGSGAGSNAGWNIYHDQIILPSSISSDMASESEVRLWTVDSSANGKWQLQDTYTVAPDDVDVSGYQTITKADFGGHQGQAGKRWLGDFSAKWDKSTDGMIVDLRGDDDTTAVTWVSAYYKDSVMYKGKLFIMGDPGVDSVDIGQQNLNYSDWQRGGSVIDYTDTKYGGGTWTKGTEEDQVTVKGVVFDKYTSGTDSNMYVYIQSDLDVY